MTNEEIKANKPEGATHYDYAGDYFKFENGVWYWWKYFGQRYEVFEHGEHSYNTGYLKPL